MLRRGVGAERVGGRGLTKPRAAVEAMISWVDQTPTILDFAGVTVAAGQVDGRSFRRAVDGANVTGWEEV
jgi:N-sulfoglucosamine sulfohydrolase